MPPSLGARPSSSLCTTAPMVWAPFGSSLALRAWYSTVPAASQPHSNRTASPTAPPLLLPLPLLSFLSQLPLPFFSSPAWLPSSLSCLTHFPPLSSFLASNWSLPRHFWWGNRATSTGRGPGGARAGNSGAGEGFCPCHLISRRQFSY